MLQEWKAGSDQRLRQSLRRGYTDAFAIKGRTCSTACNEQLLAQRVVNHAMFDASPMLDAQGDCKCRKPVQEIGGTVQWVDYPYEFVTAVAAGFFAEEAMLRVSTPDGIDDGLLGQTIDLGDKIVALLDVDREGVDAVKMAHDDSTGCACGADRDIDEGVHEGAENIMNNISIVLVGTSHPGNIGAAARAMKVMGLTRLQLVDPLHFPHEDATARASGAADLLESADVHATLDEALAGTEYVLGASARQRTIAWPSLPPRAAAEKLVREYPQAPVAVVFGRERTGLENAELERCHGLVTIPAAPGYSSLNLAAAVQVIAYELRLATLADLATEVDPGRDGPPATVDEMELLYGHLERVMLSTGFLDPDNPKHLMRRLRRLFNRAQPDQNELNILRGLLASVERPTGKKHQD